MSDTPAPAPTGPMDMMGHPLVALHALGAFFQVYCKGRSSADAMQAALQKAREASNALWAESQREKPR